jgi:hypothetical protein
MNTARQKVREELLLDGLEGAVPLTLVDSHVVQENPSASVPEVQAETLETVRALVSDGLFVLGAMSGEGGRWEAWTEPLEKSIQKISNAYLTHYDNPQVWVWASWMKITDTGRQVARALSQ